MIDRNELITELNTLLDINSYQDYGPNGLQIEGSDKLKKLAFAVSATRYTVEKACELGADALIVHHGLFWKFHGTRPLTGSFFKRVQPLILNNINLIGYHLPLDAHLKYGNAASIASEIGLENLKPFGDHKGMPTGVHGSFKTKVKPRDLQEKLAKVLDHDVIHAAPNEEEIETMGIITGGANGDWTIARDMNLDSYLTGEISEHDWHEAKEDNIHFFAGGHNATEQFGVQSIMRYIHEKFQDKELELFFIPVNNPA